MRRGLAPPRGRGGEGIAGFDGLRAVAALTVLSYHVARWSRFAPGGWVSHVLWELKGGVAIFFVISGALLYLPYARAIRDASGLADWRRYARKRCVRILPAYWVALTVVAVGPFSADVFGSAVWHYYGLSQIYSSQTLFGGLGVAWSLCVEATFYLVLPAFGWLAAGLVGDAVKRRAVLRQLVLIGAAGLGSIVFRLVLAGSVMGPVNGAMAAVALPGLFDWFAIGMLLAVLRSELEAGRGGGRAIEALVRRPRLCVLLAVVVLAAAVPSQQSDLFVPWYALPTHVALGLGSGLLVLSLFAPSSAARGRSRRVLTHPVLAWLGTISYGIYLWHYPALALVGPRLLPSAPAHPIAFVLLTWLIVVGAAVALGAASWYAVERPLQRLLRPRPNPAEVQAAPGHLREIDAGVQASLDRLNPAGVAADHLA